MTDAIIPEDVKQFLLKNIDSIAQWEGLLLLCANPAKEWSAQAVAQSIYVSEQETAHLLTQLAAQDILICSETEASVTYRYQPKSPEMAQTISRAAGLYRQYLIPVTNLIHSKPKMRVQKFADAFKIRKD